MTLARYLSPEPLLEDPKWVRSELAAGHQVPTYSYARNNPVSNLDPTGLWTLTIQCKDWQGKTMPVTVRPTGGFLPTCQDCIDADRVAATRCQAGPANVCTCAKQIARAVCSRANSYGMCKGKDSMGPPEKRDPIPNSCSPEAPSWFEE